MSLKEIFDPAMGRRGGDAVVIFLHPYRVHAYTQQ